MRTWTPLILMAVLAACGLLDSEPKSLRHAYERQGSTPLPPLLGNRVDVVLGGPTVGTPLKTDAAEAAPQIDPAELDRYLRRFAREIGEPHVAVFGILKEDGSMYRYAYARLRFGAGETGQRVVTYVVPDTANRVMRIAAAIIPADRAAESRYLSFIRPGVQSHRKGMKKTPATETGCHQVEVTEWHWQSVCDMYGLGCVWRLVETTYVETVCTQCKTTGTACSGDGDGSAGGSPYSWPPDEEDEEDEEEDEIPTIQLEPKPCVGDVKIDPKITSSGAAGVEGGRFRVGDHAVRTSKWEQYVWLNAPVNVTVKRPHYGLDISCVIGEPIYAMYSGTIIRTVSTFSPGQYRSNSLGNLVDIRSNINGEQVVIRYGHLNSVKTFTGTVNAGEVIGYCGNTGNARNTPIHVHIEVSSGCSSVFSQSCRKDPEGYMRTTFDETGQATDTQPCTL